MKHSLPAALLLSLALATPGLAATKKKKQTATPSSLPPTSPMLVVPPPDSASGDSGQAGKLISSEMSGRDLEFFTKVTDAGREVAFFVEILKKSASSGVIKKLADALTAAQAEENMHTAKLASQKGWSVSLAPTADDKKAADEILKLSGSNLDKAAMDRIVAASNEALAAYQQATQSSDSQIKIFAAQMLPLAEEKRHLVEKMTGAGPKAANQLFRHGVPSQNTPAATPQAPVAAKEATPVEKPAVEKAVPEKPAVPDKPGPVTKIEPAPK
jgi:putative membrane protein